MGQRKIQYIRPSSYYTYSSPPCLGCFDVLDHCPLTSSDIGDHRHRNRHLIHDRHVKHVNLHNGLQWNLDVTTLYITKSSVLRTTLFTPVIVKYMEKNLDITKPRYSEQILPVPWQFVISRFHCTLIKAKSVTCHI